VLEHRGGAGAHREAGVAIGGKNFQVGGWVAAKEIEIDQTPSPPIWI
jgi:hypothetical protein